jgi:pilus assembly protein CpaE
MTQPRVVAVGGANTFAPLVARVLGSTPDDIVWLPSVAVVERTVAEAAQPFDLVVLAPTVTEEDAMSVAEFISRQAPTTAVIVARDAPVDGAFPRLVRSGARDVVDLSHGASELKEALQRAVDRTEGFREGTGRAESPDGHHGVIIAVFSTKGGTGKTFLACNLAAALAEVTRGQVGLLDLDHDLGDVFAYFGTNPRRTLQELMALSEGAPPEDVIRLGTPLGDGVTGFGSPPDPRAERIPSGAMTRMLRMLKETFTVTVVDATSEYSDQVLAVFDLADVICLITGLDAIGVRHMSIGMQTLQKLGVPRDRVRVVLNRADSKVDLTAADIERALQIRVNAKIPSSPLVPRSINRARLVWHDERRSDVARAIEEFARVLQGELVPGTAAAGSSTHRRWKRG